MTEVPRTQTVRALSGPPRRTCRWPAYTPKNRATMWLDAECEIVIDPDRDERLFWKNHA
jgi:carboxylesterase type B